MLFTLSTIVALALSVSLVSAAPAASNNKRQTACSDGDAAVTLEGADPASDVVVCVNITGHSVPTNVNFDVSHITYDHSNFECSFTAQFDNCDCPAKATYTLNGNVLTVGPPQPITAIASPY